MKKPILHDLFVMSLQDLYDEENQLIEALPQMAEAASNADLKAGFEKHLSQTEEQAARLEEIAEMLDLDIEGESCEAMEGLIAEGVEAIEADMPPMVKDLAIIAAAEKVETYESTGYTTAIRLAKEMGHDDAAKLLTTTRDEEQDTAGILDSLAKKILKQVED